MPQPDHSAGLEDPRRRAQEMIARAQRLAETPRPPEGRPLAWYVEAFQAGDLPTIAALSLRQPIGR